MKTQIVILIGGADIGLGPIANISQALPYGKHDSEVKI